MSEPTDLDALAKQYLDLWQDQLGGFAKDEKAAEIMAQTMELMNAGAATFAAMATAARGQENGEDHDNANGNRSGDPQPGARSRSGPQDGPPAAAAAHGGSEPNLAEFARRLERLEERLTTLEAGSKKSRRKTAKKPRGGGS